MKVLHSQTLRKLVTFASGVAIGVLGSRLEWPREVIAPTKATVNGQVFLKEELDLTDGQSEIVASILEEAQRDRRDVLLRGRGQLEAIEEVKDAGVRATLTPHQREKYDQLLTAGPLGTERRIWRISSSDR